MASKSRSSFTISVQWLFFGVLCMDNLMQATAAGNLCEKSTVSSDQVDIKDLLSAVKSNNPLAVQSLFDKKANIRIKTTDGDTLLHLAVICENIDVLKMLIKLGLDPNEKGLNGETSLWRATESGNLTILEFLKENGADIGVRSKESGDSLLHLASRLGNDEVVSWLLGAGIEADVRNNHSETPLYAAVQGGHQIIVQLLVSKGANVNSRQEDGYTPLHEAAAFGHLAIVKYLINNGAKVNSTSLGGSTPLLKAAYGGHEMIIDELIRSGADCDVRKTTLGIAPLHAASFSLNAVKALIRNGADVNIPTFNGAKPIHWVGYGTSVDQSDIVQLLLEKRATLDGVMKNGWTPLHIAVLYSSDNHIQKLLYSGADQNVMDGNGRTPLHHLTIRNNPDLIQLFLESGADINVTDNDMETPYSWAFNRGFFDIAERLGGFMKLKEIPK